jgi:hypothetical protein
LKLRQERIYRKTEWIEGKKRREHEEDGKSERM